MSAVTMPTATVQQVSSRDPAGIGFLLSVVAKRTYTVADGGVCAASQRQLPLVTSPEWSPEDANLLLADMDVLPLKPRTDIVLMGHAYSDGAAQSKGLEVRLRVGRREKTVLVVGPRRCALSATGALVISAAGSFERMPLDFRHAYGGRDRAAEARYGNPLAPLEPFVEGTGVSTSNQSPYLYPKNPCGKGYLIEATRTAVEMIEMPNLEDPLDPLTPDRLVVGHEGRWVYMPVPQGLGWTNWGWYPRALFGGLRQEFTTENASIPEVTRGHVPRDLLEEKPGALEKHILRFANGAPIDLQVPYLVGDETLEITNAHPTERTWRIRLPGRPRSMAIDGRGGKLVSVTPVLQTVIVEPDASRVVLVWRGTGPAKRPYFPDELGGMPLLVTW